AQVDQGSQIKMIHVKEMMQDNDLKNSKSNDKGSRSRSQSMNDQSHYKQDKTKTRQSINVKNHILNVIGGRAKSDLLLNNICEVFNGKIVCGRDKPMIILLEYIREYCMKRFMNVQSVIEKCTGPLTPTTTRIIKSIKKEAHLMKVQWNGANKKWELTGIPCKHVVAACWNMALNDRATPSPEKRGGSASRQAQQTEHVVGQDGSGGSSAGVVIGLSDAAGQGGAGGPGGVGVGSQVSETRNADGREIGDGIPTQSSTAGGASEWSFLSPSDFHPPVVITKNMSAVSDNGKFIMVDEEDLIFKKISPMAEEIMVEKVADGWRDTVSYFVKKEVKKYGDDE
ncbi:hypothetical protein Tco_0209293, partial [Tanacetum coccineum]